MTFALSKVKIENWRAIEAIELEPTQDLSWFMGPNGSGKSSLLDAIAFPCDLLRYPHDPLKALERSIRGAPIAKGRWEFSGLLHDPDRPASWELTFEDFDGQRWRYRLRLAAKERAFEIVDEQLERSHEGAFVSVLEHRLTGGRLIRGGWPKGEWVPMAARELVPLLARADDPKEHAAQQGARDFLRGIWLMSPDPLLMRGSDLAYVEGQPLDRYGRDLASFLASTLSAYPEDFSQVIGSLEDLTGWRRVRALQRGVEFQEGDAKPLFLDLASDGQLLSAWLSVVSAFPPDEWTVALVDEPAVSLARNVQEQVFDWLAQLSHRVQVLAATHDERAVNRDARTRVWRVSRPPGGATTLVRLDQDPLAERVPPIFKPGDTALSAPDAAED